MFVSWIFVLNLEFNHWCWRNVVDSKAYFWVHSEFEIVFVYEVIYIYIYIYIYMYVCVYLYSHCV